VHGRAGYTIIDWPRPLITTRLELRPAAVIVYDRDQVQPRVEASAALERIDFLRPMLTADAEATLQYLAVEAYTSVGPRLRFGLKSPLGTPKLKGSIGWQIQMLRFRDLDPTIDAMESARLGLDVGWYRLGFFEQSLVADLRDDPVEPSKGGYAELRAEEGTVAAGGAFDFVRLTPEVRGYLTPALRVTLAAKLRAGAVLGDLPVTERYFAGGAQSQRGFPERRLAPTVTGMVDGSLRQTPVGGGGLVDTSFEARRQIGWMFGLNWGGVAFLDGGDVTERWQDLDLGNLEWAAGAGVRVATAIGPARLDVGYRLNRTSMDDPYAGHHLAFHLSLGEAF
jgi:translocation and assembly module TamA